MTEPLWTPEQLEQLAANGRASAKAIERDGNTPDHWPVVKLFTPMGSCTWLLSEYHEDDERFFGLCDLGMGCPELGYVGKGEIEETADTMPPMIERDLYFTPKRPLSAYAEVARLAGKITDL